MEHKFLSFDEWQKTQPAVTFESSYETIRYWAEQYTAYKLEQGRKLLEDGQRHLNMLHAPKCFHEGKRNTDPKKDHVWKLEECECNTGFHYRHVQQLLGKA